jgi:chloramphenicol 3-O-phosphotransferase
MAYIIVVSGAPGSGKTTITKLLHQHFQSVMIEVGWLRQLHLDPAWLKASVREEAMSFENLVFIIRNYLKYGYDHILVNDLEDHRVQQIPSLFASDHFIIISLVIRDDKILKRRVLDPDRDSGYRDYATAIASNQALFERPLLPNEHKFDNTNLDPEEACSRIIGLIADQHNKQ